MLPAGGYWNNTSYIDTTLFGYYWSTVIYTSNTSYTYRIEFNSREVYWKHDYSRRYGFSIRIIQQEVIGTKQLIMQVHLVIIGTHHGTNLVMYIMGFYILLVLQKHI